MVPSPVCAKPSGCTMGQTQTYYRRPSRQHRLWKVFQLQDTEKSTISLDSYQLIQNFFWPGLGIWVYIIHLARYDFFKHWLMEPMGINCYLLVSDHRSRFWSFRKGIFLVWISCLGFDDRLSPILRLETLLYDNHDGNHSVRICQNECQYTV